MILPLKDARQTFFLGETLVIPHKERKNNSSKSTKLWNFFPCLFLRQTAFRYYIDIRPLPLFVVLIFTLPCTKRTKSYDSLLKPWLPDLSFPLPNIFRNRIHFPLLLFMQQVRGSCWAERLHRANFDILHGKNTCLHNLNISCSIFGKDGSFYCQKLGKIH